ncbi:V-type ATPase, C subunit protein [Entamoeba histolytica HM-3:IMSS]|uniref:V-type proton ATPase proteolipid subunit n=1 Tax=Entamoeba histolytica HM-3:IMSS TaxID=885315 RepID=M7W2T0_ENTHI|nr:V-type ATPase, C subunit protein [Entamoeba histolytica HM-3:IMSS]
MLMSILLRSVTELCPVYSPFFGSMGITASIVFTVFGGAYGTAKSSVGISSVGVMKPEFIVRSVAPVVFAGLTWFVGLASGMAIGISGDCGVRGAAQQPKVGLIVCIHQVLKLTYLLRLID